MKNNFFICEGFKKKRDNNKKLIFYHTPKCAGTTICNILSNLITNSYRIYGPLTSLSGFKENEKIDTSYDNFNKNIELINKLKPNFLYGHIPYGLSKIFSNYLSVAMLRDPIKRSISHYNFKIQRSKKVQSIDYFFEEGIIPDNIYVRQFSAKLKKKHIGRSDFELAKKNLCEEIDYIFNVEKSSDLLNLIISIYDLPNIIFQNQQVTQKYFFNDNFKNINTIKKFNKYDIELYNYLSDKKIFFKMNNNLKSRKNELYFYWAQKKSINGKNKFIMNVSEAKKIITKLSSSNNLI